MVFEDAHSPRARELITSGVSVALSTWTITEATSAAGRLQRLGLVKARERDAIEAALDRWSQRGSGAVALLNADIGAARALLREPAVGALGAGDALHLAAAVRLGLTLATFDDTLAAAAIAVGHRVWPDTL